MYHVTIKHYDKLVRTPALAIAVEAWHSLLESEFMDSGVIAVAWDHKAVVAFIGDDPTMQIWAGVITYQDLEWSNCFNICLGYVDSDYRRRGIHTAMFKALVEKAREAGRSVITSSAHVNNRVSQRMMERQGRISHSITWNYEVPAN